MFIDSSTVISAPKFTYNIKHNITCTSTHLIYCIPCSRCGMLYIGETGRQLRTRVGEHRRAVSANDANQPVARHFNSGSHCISDMKIRALCPISGSIKTRVLPPPPHTHTNSRRKAFARNVKSVSLR